MMEKQKQELLISTRLWFGWLFFRVQEGRLRGRVFVTRLEHDDIIPESVEGLAEEEK